MDACNASESTVRRDLEFLDGIGQIRRTRGGAAFVGESLSGFEDRSRHASREKQAIAKAAAELIQPEETLILDGGTTTLEVAKQLIGKPYQIVTNSLPIANLLANQSGVELVLIGGYLYPKTGVALGPVAVAGLKNINAHRLIMSVGGITEKGLFNSNALLVETERQMMQSADRSDRGLRQRETGTLGPLAPVRTGGHPPPRGGLRHLAPLAANLSKTRRASRLTIVDIGPVPRQLKNPKPTFTPFDDKNHDAGFIRHQPLGNRTTGPPGACRANAKPHRPQRSPNPILWL